MKWISLIRERERERERKRTNLKRNSEKTEKETPLPPSPLIADNPGHFPVHATNLHRSVISRILKQNIQFTVIARFSTSHNNKKILQKINCSSIQILSTYYIMYHRKMFVLRSGCLQKGFKFDTLTDLTVVELVTLISPSFCFRNN